MSVCANLKIVDDLGQHLAVLSSQTDECLDVIGAPGALLDDGCHLNRFRPGAEYQQGSQSIHRRHLQREVVANNSRVNRRNNTRITPCP